MSLSQATGSRLWSPHTFTQQYGGWEDDVGDSRAMHGNLTFNEATQAFTSPRVNPRPRNNKYETRVNATYSHGVDDGQWHNLEFQLTTRHVPTVNYSVDLANGN